MEAQAPIDARTASESSTKTKPWAEVATSPEALFHAHYSRLVEAIAAASGDDDGAADAVQEAFVQLWKHWEKVRSYDDQCSNAEVALHNPRYASGAIEVAEESRSSQHLAHGMSRILPMAFRAARSR